MGASKKHFVNDRFLAPNVLEVAVDPAVVADLAPVVARLQQPGLPEGMVDVGAGVSLYATHPGWNSDIKWISQADRAGYDWFEGIFRRLRVAENAAQYIAYDREIVMYSGFFVTRSYCTEPNYHHDWVDAGNDAFTFLAPLSDNCGELGLVFQNLRGQQARYTYRAGKGLVFGDFFLHSTAPGQASGQTVFLSFTFGTDRMEHWDRIARTAASQGMFHRRPDGEFVSTRGTPAAY